MSTDAKRTTIYITQDLQETLDKLKKERYYKKSQSAMISRLIKLGADIEEKKPEQSQETNKEAV